MVKTPGGKLVVHHLKKKAVSIDGGVGGGVGWAWAMDRGHVGVGRIGWTEKWRKGQTVPKPKPPNTKNTSPME